MEKVLEKIFEHPIAAGLGFVIFIGGVCKIIRCCNEEKKRNSMTPEQLIEYEKAKHTYTPTNMTEVKEEVINVDAGE